MALQLKNLIHLVLSGAGTLKVKTQQW